MATSLPKLEPHRRRWPGGWEPESDGDLIKVDPRPGKSRGTKIKSNNWSGFVACRRTNDTTINRVEAIWTVPCCRLPKGSKDGQWYTCSSWIGIGGAGRPGDESQNMLQVGFDYDYMMEAGDSSKWYNTWYQWVPDEDVAWLPEFIQPGETLGAAIEIQTQRGSVTTATIYLHNQTTGKGAEIQVPNPSGIKITGNCAEWIVEKVEFAGNTPALGRYGVVCFDEARAFTDRGEELDLNDGELGIRYHMIDNGTVLSEGALLGDHAVRCAYVGPGGRRQTHDQFFSPDDAAELGRIASELEKSSGSQDLGRIKQIVKNIQVKHYRSGCPG